MASSAAPTMTPEEFAAYRKRLEEPETQPQLKVGDETPSYLKPLQYVGEASGASMRAIGDSLTLGWAPHLIDMVNGNTAQKDQLELDRINHGVAAPVASGLSYALGPSGVVSKGVAKGGSILADKFASPVWRKLTSGVGPVGGGGNAAATAAVTSTADELSRSTQQDRDFNIVKPLRDTGISGVLGALFGKLFQGTAPNAVRTQVGGTGNKTPDLPTTKADPTGTIPDQPLRGPEALKAEGLSEQARLAERMRMDANRKMGTSSAPAGRDAAVQRGGDILQTDADIAAQRLAGSPKVGDLPAEQAQRLPGMDAMIPSAQTMRDQVTRAAGLPTGPAGKDTGDMWLKTLEAMKANRAITPPDQLPQLEKDIEALTARLAATKPATPNKPAQPRMPLSMADIAAKEKAGQFKDVWGDVPVMPAPPSGKGQGGMIGAALPTVGGWLGGKVGFPGAGAAAGQAVRSLMPGGSSLPAFANPQKIAGILEDPAVLSQILRDPSYFRLLQTNLVPAAGLHEMQGVTESFSGGAKKRRKGRKELD